MILHIAKKEIKETLRSGQFKWILGITVLLSLVAIFISQEQWESKSIQREISEDKERELWLAQGSVNPHNAGHYGTYAFKPQFPLSMIDPGVEKFTGISIFLESHNKNEADNVAATDQTGLSRFGDLTPEFVLLFIVPLMIMALGHRAITGEKERGTIRIIQTQGVSNQQLIIGKWLANYIPVVLITSIIFLLASIVIHKFDWTLLATMWAVYLVYFAVINSLTIIISSLVKTSGTSLVILLSIWIVNCLVVPKLVSSYTNQEYPYPTKQELAALISEDKKEGIDGHAPWSDASKKLEEETLKAYNVNKLEELPFNFDALRMQKGEEHSAKIYAKHYDNLKAINQNQTKVYQRLAFLSPFLPTRFTSMTLAGTDYNTHWNFADQAEKHRVEMQRILNGDFAENSKLGDWGYQAEASLLEEVPEFQFKGTGYKETIYAARTNLLILSAWLLLSTGLMFFVSNRI